MSDLLLNLTDRGADLVLEGGDVALDHGLLTPVLVSLFSDARAREDDELPAGEGSDPRGWWAAEPGDAYGSRLWLLARAKITAETVNQVREHASDALRWLVAAEIAERVDVDAVRIGSQRIDLSIAIRRGTAARWASLWTGTAETTFAAGAVRVHLGVA